jgi:Cu2+-exporting ATPase
MLPLAIGIFAGGAALVSAKATNKRKKRRLVDVLNGKTAVNAEKQFGIKLTEAVSRQSPRLGKWLASAVASLEKLDDNYQQRIKKHLDPLLAGNRREQYFKELSAGRKSALSLREKSINRQIALGVGLFGLLGLTSVATLPLVVPAAIAIGLYLTLPLYKAAYEIAVVERRLSMLHFMALYFTVLWVGGYYVLGMLAAVVSSLSQKVLMICENVSRYELVNVFHQQPRTVWVLMEGTEMEIPFEQLKAGDTLALDVGQTIAVDGVVLAGFASVDQRVLTGESLPVDKGVGDTVLAFTVVLSGRIFVRVDKTGAETSAAQIGEILNRSTEYQLSMEARAIKIADRTLIPMLVTSVASVPFVGPAGAIAVLGSNFTLNMVWLRVLTLLNFLNVASKHKILVKDGEALERLKNIDTVVFDKTGTLTVDQPHVVNVHACVGYSSEDVLILAAAAEHRQVHPVAKAILAAANERQLVLPSVDEAQYEIGFGIKVKLQEQWAYVGSRRFMAVENIAVPTDMQALETRCSLQGHSLVYIGVDGALAGLVQLKTTTRPEAAETVRRLHERGLKLYIISGDSEQPTKALAQELGIDGYFAGTLPERKADLIKQLQAEGRKVCFVGDGINDAIALHQADVSISLTGATTAATDTAQVVLMDADLKQFITLMDLAYALDDNVDRNFKAALAMSFLSIGGVLFFHAGFLLVEVLAALSMIVGVGIASQPLIGKDDKIPDQEILLHRLLPSADKA